MGFLRKVYGILSAQLVMTTLVAALFMSSERVKGFVQGSPNVLFSAMILSFVMMIALFVKRKETPTNYILLGLFVSKETKSRLMFVLLINVTQVSMSTS